MTEEEQQEQEHENKRIRPRERALGQKLPFFLDSSLGIPYIVLWFNVCNKELLALRNNFRVTQKFLIAKFDCIILNRCMYFETCPCARR